MDTDSFFIKIKAKDVYEDLTHQIMKLIDHYLYEKTRKRLD